MPRAGNERLSYAAVQAEKQSLACLVSGGWEEREVPGAAASRNPHRIKVWAPGNRTQG